MRVWVAARYGWLILNKDRPAARGEMPMRTIYNSRTCQEEPMSLVEVQHLLKQGQIQAVISRDDDGRARYRFLLV